MTENYKELLNRSAFFNKNISTASVASTASTARPVRLNIASGPNVFPFDGWINYDRIDIAEYLDYISGNSKLEEMPTYQRALAQYIRSGNKIDFRIQDLRQGFPQHPDNSVDSIYLGQMIEHMSITYGVPSLLVECYRMLRPGGIIRIATPDLDLLIRAYNEGRMNDFSSEQPGYYKIADPASQLAMIMFGATGPNCTFDNYEGHFFLFTKTSMTTSLKLAGYKDIEFYYETGKSKDPILAAQVTDFGISHSFIAEAIK